MLKSQKTRPKQFRLYFWGGYAFPWWYDDEGWDYVELQWYKKIIANGLIALLIYFIWKMNIIAIITLLMSLIPAHRLLIWMFPKAPTYVDIETKQKMH